MYRFFYFILIGFVGISCTLELPQQFSPNSDKEDQIFSIEDVQNLNCGLRTSSILEKNSLDIPAQNLVIEANKSPSVVFHSESGSAPPLINNLPIVQYEVEGSSVCQLLLNQKTLRLIAQPQTYYDVHFQVTGAYLKVFISGDLHHLPYQQLSQRVKMSNGQYALPLGVYSILQGRVQPMKNVENREIHILDFFPSEEPLVSSKDSKGFVHWLRPDSEDIFISNLNGGLTPYQYQEKRNILPKNYFDGVWYSQVSLNLTEPLQSQGKFGSGVSVSGNKYSGRTSGQKVYFKFESKSLKALNYNYARQTQSLGLNSSAEAEVLSIPIEHLDYRNTLDENEDVSQEMINRSISWKDKKYVSAQFDDVSDFFRNWVQQVGHRYGLGNSSETSLKEIKFASNYFDFTIYDGTFEYRFSFFKREKDSQYKPKTVASTDLRFEFFNVPYNQIFVSPLDFSNQEYEKKINLLRPQPDSNGKVHLRFSHLTPDDDKIRSIGREAVSVWNQALKKASVPLSLVLHENQDVNLGDSRYHVLHIPTELKKAYGGIAQTLVDDETGEVISSTSTVLLDDYKFFLERKVIDYAYTKYEINNPLSSSEVEYPKITNSRISYPSRMRTLPFSLDALEYVWAQSVVNRNQKSIFPFSVKNSWYESVLQYFKIQRDKKNEWLSQFSNPSISNMHNLSPELQKWLSDFKIHYALTHQKFAEDESWDVIRNNVREWNVTNNVSLPPMSQLYKILSEVCHFLPHPSEDPEFKQSVRQCVESILPLYGLGVAVHEIGHSIFSLRHNFAGSTDDLHIQNSPSYTLDHLKPYLSYTNSSGEEASIEKLFPPVSSSVMEYIGVANGDQWGPGAYDIAAIQYLFSDSSETLDETSSIPFKRCSDYEVDRSAYCLTHDQGVNPLQITENSIRDLMQYLDQNFYDLDYSSSSFTYHFNLFRQIKRLVVIYGEWRKKLKEFSVQMFNENPEKLDQEQWKKLTDEIVRVGKKEDAHPKNKELYHFYQARNLIYHTLTYLSFLPNRYCVLKKDWSQFQDLEDKKWKPPVYVLLELSKVIAHERLDDNKPQLVSLLSCWSDEKKNQPHPEVQKYMDVHYSGYELAQEVGHFLYPDSFPKNAPYRHLFSESTYKGSFLLRLFSFIGLSFTQPFYQSGELSYFSMLSEHDIAQGVERLLAARLTRGVFLYKDDFFKSLQNTSYENLTPETSAKLLFEFSPVEKDRDIVLRDDLIQPSKLIDQASKPYMRDDRNGINFYQNFSEESSLLNLFSSFFKFSYILSSGLSDYSITEKNADWTRNLDLFPSLTSFMLANKARNHIAYNIYPQLSSLYYFELDNILILPSFAMSSDNLGHHVLSELSKNSVRRLWTSSHNEVLKTSNHPDFQDKSLVTALMGYLQKLLQQYQGTRLGRFYFMYAYLSILGQLEAYEYVMRMQSPIDFHTQALKWTDYFENTINDLFYFKKCNMKDIDTYIGHLAHAVPSLHQGDPQYRDRERFGLGALKVILQKKLQLQYAQYCPPPLKGRGKMVNMFHKQGLVLSNKESRDWGRPFYNSEEKLYRPTQRYLTNFQFQNTLSSLGSHLSSHGGVEGIPLTIKLIFSSLFSTSEDTPLIRSRISMLRQLMVDMIPKMMLMYSEDRIFIGEMLLLTSVIHQFCFYADQSSHTCRVATEKIIGHYFKGSNYGQGENISNILKGILSGYIPGDKGMPLNLLVSEDANGYRDRSINTLPFDIEVMTDYLFYERGWDASKVSGIELDAQRELLFSLVPLTSLRMVNSSLIFKLSGWNPFVL